MPSRELPHEIALVGDLNNSESDFTQKLLEVPPGGECIVYFDCPGGSPYSALAAMSLIVMRGLRATGVVTGECSSAALWPWAACRRRLVTPYSVLLFHPMKWQSDEHVLLGEAAEWARHFGQLEQDMDQLLAGMFGMEPARLAQWMQPGRYLGGREVAAEGIAELVNLAQLDLFGNNGQFRPPRRAKAARP